MVVCCSMELLPSLAQHLHRTLPEAGGGTSIQDAAKLSFRQCSILTASGDGHEIHTYRSPTITVINTCGIQAVIFFMKEMDRQHGERVRLAYAGSTAYWHLVQWTVATQNWVFTVLVL